MSRAICENARVAGTTAEGTRPRRPRGDTAQRILDVAEGLAQVRGFNAFSYGDVAAELAITTASLHYHFAGKAELGHALVARYADRFARALATIDERSATAPEKLAAYARLYSDVLDDERMCLCGMLAAEYQTLPAEVGQAVVAFFDDNESWLERVLDAGHGAGTLRFEASARETARLLIGDLEGAMLLARLYGDRGRFGAATERLISTVAVAGD